jgi:putative tricarboxylic transport membrane protein
MKSDVIVGIAGLALGISYFVQSLALPKAFIGNPWAPIYFPLSLGILMILCSAILLYTGIRKKRREEKILTSVPWFYVLGTMVIGFIYAFIFNKTGFIPSTIFFIGSLLIIINGKKGIITNIIITIGLTLGIWYCFEKILYISLP